MTSQVITEMIDYYAGDSKRIEHFMKVFAYAKCIGEEEGFDEKTQEILEVAAIVHDIGIKVSEEKYHSSAGKYQEIEGPKIAQELLLKLGYKREFVDRVCYLVGHHHTYSNIDGMDYQALIEADFLVNLVEEKSEAEVFLSIEKKIFKTKTGIRYLRSLVG